MRRIKQIAVDEKVVYALCEDGTMWTCVRAFKASGWVHSDWQHNDGPPEGRPDYKETTLEDIAEKLRVDGGQTFVGRGHHLAGNPEENNK